MKPKIMLHTISPGKKNGPNSVNDCIRESKLLQSEFEIVNLEQTLLPGKNPIKLYRLISGLKKSIRQYDPDIVAVTGLQFAGFCATLAAKLAHVKHIVVCVHGFSGDAKGISRVMRFLYNCVIEPLTIKMAESVYTVCQYGANRKMIRRYAKKNFFGTVHNCLPPVTQEIKPGFREEFGISKDKCVVVSVGRVIYDKGHCEIIEALKLGLCDKVVLVIVGDGPYLKHYEEECREYIENGKLVLAGQRSDVLSILKESDIFLFPTHHENLSMALLEACFMKCTIIATNIDGNPEVILDRQNGILIPVQSAEAIRITVNELADDVALREQYSEKAYIMVRQEFSYELFEKRMLHLYKSVLDQG